MRNFRGGVEKFSGGLRNLRGGGGLRNFRGGSEKFSGRGVEKFFGVGGCEIFGGLRNFRGGVEKFSGGDEKFSGERVESGGVKFFR